jgi:glycosyltransferase involved in cell wall biosynthesis
MTRLSVAESSEAHGRRVDRAAERIRVLVVTNMYPSAENPALGTFVQEQVESLREKGVRVEVLFVNGPQRTLNYFTGIVRYVWHMLRHGREYDLVHAHYVFSGLIARLQWIKPVILTHHGIEVIWGWQGPLSRWVSRWVDRVIVTSRAVADSLGRAGVTVIPCGVDLDLFRPIPRDEARHRLGLDPGKRYIVYAGRTGPEKRLDIIEEAVARLQANDSETRLLLLTEKAHEVVPLYLSAADALVLASDFEGSPTVIKEAMACNLPIVSTDVGDVADLIGDTDGCYLCERTPEDVADKLQRALSFGSRTEGRKAVQHLSLPAIADRIIEVYGEVLA